MKKILAHFYCASAVALSSLCVFRGMAEAYNENLEGFLLCLIASVLSLPAGNLMVARSVHWEMN